MRLNGYDKFLGRMDCQGGGRGRVCGQFERELLGVIVQSCAEPSKDNLSGFRPRDPPIAVFSNSTVGKNTHKVIHPQCTLT